MLRKITGNGKSIQLGGRTLVMGIVNVTPDSFHDGGRYDTIQTAVEHGIRLVEEGADILDIGGQSTRPGSDPIPLEKELARVLPVIERLSTLLDLPISIDTDKAEVARLALEAGANWINDISAGRNDPGMFGIVSAADVPYVAMHMRGTPKTMQQNTSYGDLIGEIAGYFEERLLMMRASGIDLEKVFLDPGIGFGKEPERNFELLANLAAFRSLGQPLLVGPSRKSFLKLVGGETSEDRLPGTLAAVTLCALEGVDVVRVHDVAAALQAVKLADRVRSNRTAPA